MAYLAYSVRHSAAVVVWHFTDLTVLRFLLNDEPTITAAQTEAIVDFSVDAPGGPYNRYASAILLL